MTEQEFLYAALCNHQAKGQEKARKYIEENPKSEYTCDDWVAVFYSDPEPIKTGNSRPLMSPLCMNGTFCYTTRQWT